MKLKFWSALFVMIFSSIVMAQSVVVTPEKITYKRPKPRADFKKTFTINYPRISGIEKTLSGKIEQTISYENVLSVNIKEEQTAVQWLENADFEVIYNQKGVFCISLFIEGAGAYPSTVNRSVVVDLKTGGKVWAKDVFINLDGLAAKIKEIQRKEIQESIEEIKNDPDSGEKDPERLFENADFTSGNLEDFEVKAAGVSFTYSYGFPHVIQALEPGGNYFLTWPELRSFIKKDGIFGQFVFSKDSLIVKDLLK